ncbi:MAG: DNA alkylation repair protein [bacterium]|nr:DNA alkylation repair protein [bacterium]
MEEKILKDIRSHRDERQGTVLGRFFKTGKGQYGEGDIFWGLDVPTSRKIAERYTHISRKDLSKLLKNEVHEVRFIALLILVAQYKKAKGNSDQKEKEELVKFYLDNTKYVNNWDLVDSSAHQILGDLLLDKNDIEKRILLTLSHSKDLWEQRIAIVATFAFIRRGDLDWTYKIIDTLDKHTHDLIHKACGWMLREAGKKDEKRLKEYLDRKAATLPRTMLRYAIEKFPESERLEYLNKK